VPVAADPFDIAQARSALSAAAGAAAGCGDGSGTKLAQVSVTFAPSGRVTTALVSGPTAGTRAGSCVARAFRSAQIAPFAGSFVTVQRTVRLN
jgi:hypothetical protein